MNTSSDDLKQLSAITSLNNMFEKGWFSICAIDTIAKMLEIDPKCESYTILSTLHCVHFNKMPTILRDQIPNLIKDCLGVQPFFQFTKEDLYQSNAIVDTVTPPKSGGFLRLIGMKK